MADERDEFVLAEQKRRINRIREEAQAQENNFEDMFKKMLKSENSRKALQQDALKAMRAAESGQQPIREQEHFGGVATDVTGYEENPWDRD